LGIKSKSKAPYFINTHYAPVGTPQKPQQTQTQYDITLNVTHSPELLNKTINIVKAMMGLDCQWHSRIQ